MMADRFLQGGYIALLMVWGYILLDALIAKTTKGVIAIVVMYWQKRQEFFNYMAQCESQEDKET